MTAEPVIAAFNRRPGWLGCALMCIAAHAHAEGWRITPRIAVSETLTNNLFLTSTNRTSDLVTGITPGISIEGQGGRASLRLNYGLTQNLYARESSQNNLQHALNAFGTLEAIEDWFFIDASGTISQQLISAFGQTSPSDANINNNQTETAYYSISPYIRGRFLSSTEYLLRYTASTTRADSSQVSDTTTNQWLGRINGNTRWGPLSWSLDASSNSVQYDIGRDRDDTRYGLTLSYRLTPQFQFSLIAGRETNNLVSLEDETYSDSGYGFVWTPSPRTKLDARMTRRFFGNGYKLLSVTGCRAHCSAIRRAGMSRISQQASEIPGRAATTTPTMRSSLPAIPGLRLMRSGHRSIRFCKAEVCRQTELLSTVP
jgi:uncharacterized protein (PEP-CTERM system associated)